MFDGFKSLWKCQSSIILKTININFLSKKAAYVNTGVWASKAIKEAKYYGETLVLASSEADNFTYIPKNYEIPNDVDYFH